MLLVIPRQPVAKFAVCMGEGIIEPDGKPMSPTEFTISGFLAVARADTMANVQDNLDVWLGSLHTAASVSVEQAIAADPTLGGTVEWCNTTVVDGYGPIDWAGSMYFGARFNWNVSAR